MTMAMTMTMAMAMTMSLGRTLLNAAKPSPKNDPDFLQI